MAAMAAACSLAHSPSPCCPSLGALPARRQSRFRAAGPGRRAGIRGSGWWSSLSASAVYTLLGCCIVADEGGVACAPATLRIAFLPSVRAASSEESAGSDLSKTAEGFLADVKSKWESVDNKSAVALYGGGALIGLWLSSTIVGAINSVPLLPKVMELIGLGYTGWFVYRYLLFKSSRKELVADIEELKGKITGANPEE